MSDLKHACHECGRNIEYPEQMFGQTVSCPHCARETSLGEVYPDASSTVSYPPPPHPKSVASASTGTISSQFYVTRDGKEFGPYTLDDVQGYLETGFLKSSDLGWCDGMQDWKPLNTIEGIIIANKTGHPPPPRPVMPKPGSSQPYTDYSQVPYYRKQWFFWIMYFTISPVALGLLISGDIYYPKRGQVKSFGSANRIVALIFGLAFVGFFLSGISKESHNESGTSKGQIESGKVVPAMPSQPATPPRMTADDNLLVAEAKLADELIEQLKSTEDAFRMSWNRGIRDDIGGLAQLAMIRDQIVPVVRETKNRIEQFQPKSPKLQRVRAAMLELVQYDFSSWIGVNNAAAAGNWIAARGLFDRMEIDRAMHLRKLKSAIDTAVSN